MKRFLGEFKEFALRGNVVDLAVGIIIGSAFNTIVNSLVKDIIMPPLGLVLSRVDFSSLYVDLSRGEYKSLAEAQAAGAPTLNYGLFINNLISFLITAFVIFLLVKWINRMRRKQDKAEETSLTKNCQFCYSAIPLKATRCPQCTSTLT